MSPRDTGARQDADETAGHAAVPFAAFDPAMMFAQQQRLAEATIAAGQKLLEGLQDVTTRSLQLQTVLAQQTLMNASGLWPWAASGGTERATTSASMDSVVTSIRDVMAAACKCSTAALATYRERLGTEPAGGSDRCPMCGHPPPAE